MRKKRRSEAELLQARLERDMMAALLAPAKVSMIFCGTSNQPLLHTHSPTTHCVLRNSIGTFTSQTEDEVDPDAALLRRQARLLAGQEEGERREAESAYRLQLLRIR